MGEMIVSPVVEAAWQDYQQGLTEIRRLLYTQSWGRHPEAESAAHYYLLQLQAAAFNLAIGARQDYPTPYCHIASEPNVYTWGVPAADFKYRWSVLDGRRTYRIFGKRNSTLFLDIQSISALLGSGGKLLGSYDLDDLVAGDGSFEIIVSATPHEGNWIPLDPESPRNLILIREVFGDWERDEPVDLHIELADDIPPGCLLIGDQDLADKMRAAIAFMRMIVTKWAIETNDVILDAVGTNQLHQEAFADNAGSANNPRATYPSMIFDIADDEAIIIECDIPEEITYWNIQIGDVWHQAVDFSYHQSSLNALQSAIDPDGVFRCVVAVKDPGVWNWLDTVGLHYGFLICRLYRFNRFVRPTARKVKLADLTTELPASTRWATAEERNEQLRVRKTSIRRRFGY